MKIIKHFDSCISKVRCGIQSHFPCCLNWKSISSCLLVLAIKSLYLSFPLFKTVCCLPFPISGAERGSTGSWKIFHIICFASSLLFHCFKRIKPVASICLTAINWLKMIRTLLPLEQGYPVIWFRGIYLTLKEFFVCLSWRGRSFSLQPL